MFTALGLLCRTVLVKGRRRRLSRPARRTPRLMLEALETRTVPSASAPFAPAEIAAAYGAPSVVSNPNNTTIAIVDAYNDPNIASNLATFDSQWGIAAPPSFKQVNETGGTNLPAGNASWGLEISLDVEWAHAMDPTANLLLVEASSASTSDLLKAVGYAASPTSGHASVVSMSWGSSEFNGETTYDTGSGGISGFNGFSSYSNVTFVASSGDTGAEVEWPAVSPYVVSVGGTTLTINSSTSGGVTTYSYGSESAWSAGGGGTSVYEGLPTASQGLVEPSAKARTTPDVSYDANPNSGVYVYDTYGAGGWYEVGGTSAGAPQWAAIIALADQQRAALAGALNTATVQATLYSNPQDLNDVTTGSNGHAATVGYDLATGLGTPKASAVVAALTNATLLSSVIKQGPAPSGGGGGGGGGHKRNAETDPIALQIESDATAVVTVAPSAGTPSVNAHAVVAVGTPVSGGAVAAPPWASSSWQSGGGGGVSDGTLLGDGAVPTDAPTTGAVMTQGVGNLPWLGNLFTEAVRRLQVPFTALPPGAPAAPIDRNPPQAPMKEQAAPMPAGKVGGAIRLEQIELYAVPAAVGLCGAGFEIEERRRRRLLEKPR